MIISTFIALYTLTTNLILIISGMCVMGATGGMIVICGYMLHSLKESSQVRERMLQFSLEEIAEKMAGEYKENMRKFEDLLEDLNRRTYR